MQKIKAKKHYILFHPGDWLGDLALNACSLQTQGAWIRLLCYMHESELCGYLITNGKPMEKKAIQKLMKIDNENFDSIWTELIENGVMKRDEKTGAYFSKRMINDHEKYVLKAETNEVSWKKIAEQASAIIDYLNKKAKKDYSVADPEYIKRIGQKFESGYQMIDFKKVIDYKSEEWLGDKKMDQFLRPTTLFGDKFGEYLTQANQNVKTEKANKTVASNPYNNMRK